eukprot:261741_1
MSASNPAIKRIMQECKRMRKDPSNGIVAAPLENNLFEWHFTIKGANKTEFEGGKYHGKFILPSEYPFKAPDIIMLTKSGRFEVGKKICLNFTGYHHELWQPAWTIRTMLTALRAFMETHAKGIGAMSVNKEQRKRYAKLSLSYKCPKCNVCLKDIDFPEVENEATAKDTNKDDEDTQPKQDDTMDDTHHNHDHTSADDTPSQSNSNQTEQTSNTEPESEQHLLGSNVDIVTDNVVETPVIPVNRKDQLLDSFTVFLVILIAAILLKKFASRVMEQL